MPTWNQIQSQLRNPNNPVVFFDISVGATVSRQYYKALPVFIYGTEFLNGMLVWLCLFTI